MLHELKTKTTNELVQEIHSEFDLAGERMVKEAKRIISRPPTELIEKSKKAIALGFTNSKAAVIGKNASYNIERCNTDLQSAEYFGIHYPFYKFINEKEVERICKKYGLVLGQADWYVGDIPDKNLSEIENFKLRMEDFIEIYTPVFNWLSFTSPFRNLSREQDQIDNILRNNETIKEKPAFKIVAPKNDFKKENISIKDDYKLELHIPDPIVLQPVKGGYLIVSKWGLEGEDKDLVNEKSN